MEAIGSLATALVARSTGSPSHSVEPQSALVRPITGNPATMDECRALAAWAETLPTVDQPMASDNFIVNRLEYIQATLPAKALDEGAGEKRTAVYVSILRGASRKALEYMADRACRELRWFPTPKECLDILERYRPPATQRETTLLVCMAFAQDAFDRWLANIRDGQEIGDVPDQWKRIAVEQFALRRLDDGSYVSRARFIGPTLAGKFVGG